MTRRNEKRNNRRNRQRSNKTELSPFSQMIIGALLGKGAEMIAKYLNEGWKPDFTLICPYTICKNCDGVYSLLCNHKPQAGAIYFKTEELAKEAIRIMGEDSLNDLFSTDW